MRRADVRLWALVTASIAACGGEQDEAQRLEALSSLRVEGEVTLRASGATDVQVTGHCGQYDYTTQTDELGTYALDVDLEECERLTIEFVKNGFLPHYAVIDLPPPSSPLTVDVALTELEELECGREVCHTQSGTDVDTDGVIARGYQLSGSGSRALPMIPREFKTEDDALIAFLGMHYLELRDIEGKPIDRVGPLQGCSPIDSVGLDRTGDIDPATPEVELSWFRYDALLGRWQTQPAPALLMYERGNAFEFDADGECVELVDDLNMPIKDLQPVEVAALPDVRVGEFEVEDPCSTANPPRSRAVRRYWVCGEVAESGFYAYGLTVPETSCYALQLHGDCELPLSNVQLAVEGVEHGYQAEATTGPDGQACVEVLASEPVGEDYDLDGLGGEIFRVDITLGGALGVRRTVAKQENSRELGSCDEPDSCIALREEVTRCR